MTARKKPAANPAPLCRFCGHPSDEHSFFTTHPCSLCECEHFEAAGAEAET